MTFHVILHLNHLKQNVWDGFTTIINLVLPSTDNSFEQSPHQQFCRCWFWTKIMILFHWRCWEVPHLLILRLTANLFLSSPRKRNTNLGVQLVRNLFSLGSGWNKTWEDYWWSKCSATATLPRRSLSSVYCLQEVAGIHSSGNRSSVTLRQREKKTDRRYYNPGNPPLRWRSGVWGASYCSSTWRDQILKQRISTLSPNQM